MTAQDAIEAVGSTLAYRRYGPQLDRTLVLLHGARMDGRVWDASVQVLARTRDVLLPDLRGRGRSNCDPAVPASFIADTRLLIDRLGLAHVDLVGHSMGGGVALELAWQLAGSGLPHPLSTLTLVAPTPTAGWEPPPGIAAFSGRIAKLAGAGDGEAAFDTQLTNLWLSNGRPRGSLNPQAVDRARSVFLQNVNAPWPPPLQEHQPTQLTDYARLDVPTLILTGDADHPDVRNVARALASIVPHASLTELPECGHDIPNEQPDKLAALILDHVFAYS